MATNYDHIRDEELMPAISAGDAQAFSALVRRHTTRFYAAAFRIVQNREDAEDVVQDAFTKLWNGKASWQDGKGAKFTTWFYRIITNQAVDMMNKKRRQRTSMLDGNVPSGDANVEIQAVARQEAQAVTTAMAELPERQKVAVMLFFGEEMSQKEAAEVMGITPKAVESLIGRAKQALKERMQEYA